MLDLFFIGLDCYFDMLKLLDEFFESSECYTWL